MTDTLLRATLQSGVALLVIAVLCRLFSKLSPDVRCWLWRLGYLKCLLALALPLTLAVPLLPVAPPVPEIVPPASTELVSMSSTVPAATAALPATIVSIPASTTVVPTPEATVPILSIVAGLYLLGAGMALLRLVVAAAQTRALLQQATPVSLPALPALCARFGLRRAPRVARLAGFSSPLLAFGTILLPEPALADEELIVAHELAHLKRRDLLWEALGALVGVLLWFHPLVWWARREEKLAREQAADALALAVTAAPRAEYARVLLTATLAHTPELAVGAFASPSRLRRRLEALAQPALPRRKAAVLLALAFVLVLPVLIPWRAVARQGALPTTHPRPTERDRTFSIEGTVVEHGGRPIGKARVRLVGMTRPGSLRIKGQRIPAPKATYAVLAETLTAADGTYKIPSRTHKPGETLVVEAEGYSVTTRLLTGGRVTLEPARRWVALLTDGKGRPLAGRKLRVVPVTAALRALYPSYVAGTTDAQGRFITGPLGTFSGGSGKEKLFELDDPELAISETVPTLSRETVLQRLVATPARRLLGEVVDGSGQPVPRATVTLRPYTRLSDDLRTYSDSQGHFKIAPLAPGDYLIDVTPDASVRESQVPIAPRRFVRYALGAALVTKLRIPLTAGVTVRGRVVSGETGKPLANIPLSLLRPLQFEKDQRLLNFGSSIRPQGVTDAQGYYTLQLPADEDCAILLSGLRAPKPLDLSSREPAQLSRPVRGKNGQTLTENFTVRAPRPAVGKVVDTAGRPVPGATIRVGMAKGVSDTEGRFSFPESVLGFGVQEGERSKNGISAHYREEITTARIVATKGELRGEGLVHAKDTAPITLVLKTDQWVTVKGKVLSPEGQVPPGLEIRVNGRGSQERASNPIVTKDASGSFTARTVPGSSISVSIRAPNFGFLQETFPETLATGTVKDMGTLILPKANGTLSGQVRDARGKVPQNAFVTVFGKHTFARNKLDARGRFSLNGVVASDSLEVSIGVVSGSKTNVWNRFPVQANRTNLLLKLSPKPNYTMPFARSDEGR